MTDAEIREKAERSALEYEREAAEIIVMYTNMPRHSAEQLVHCLRQAAMCRVSWALTRP